MISAMHHVSLVVSDTGQAVDFYHHLLGIPLAERPQLGFPGAWLALGAQQIHLLEVDNVDPVEGRPEHVGRDRHLALSCDDLDGITRALDRAGVVYSRSRSGRNAIFCRDPDGNGVEIVAM